MDNSKKGGPEQGQMIAADSSIHGPRQPVALTADRRRSTSLTSQDLSRRQSLGRDMRRHTSLESIGSQELFGWHVDGKKGEPLPAIPAESAVTPGRPVLQTADSYSKSPRLPKPAKRLED